jgi:hypothetical protein
LIDQVSNVPFATHICPDEERFRAQASQLRDQRLSDIVAAPGDDEVRPFSCESQGRRTANACKGAGNKNNGISHPSPHVVERVAAAMCNVSHAKKDALLGWIKAGSPIKTIMAAPHKTSKTL